MAGVAAAGAGVAGAAASSWKFPDVRGEVQAAWTSMKAGFEGVVNNIRVSGLQVNQGMYPMGFMVGLLLLFLLVSIWYIQQLRFLATPGNIARILNENVRAEDHYITDAPARKGLPALCDKLLKEGYTDEDLILTNFYTYSVNATGLFFPAKNGVVSTDAAKLAVLAGARCFVFDIWPDLEPHGDFGPVIEAMDEGSLWRRTTLNALPLAAVLPAVVQTALPLAGNTYVPPDPGSLLQIPPLGPNQGQGQQDPVFLYLRFRGAPRPSTFDHVADILTSTILPYRLDAKFNHCRNMDTLFQVPMRQLYSKVVVISNTQGSGKFSDFVNFAPRTGIPLEYQADQLQLTTGDTKMKAITTIKQNLTFVAPLSEDRLAETNDFSVRMAQELGVHFVAMDLWAAGKGPQLKAYQTMFNPYSFVFKPENLRYTIKHLNAPLAAPNPNWGNAAEGQAGVFRAPPAIQFPGT